MPLTEAAGGRLGPRILHIWNTAGVASVIAKFTDRQFQTSSRVMTRKAADRVGLTTYGDTYADGAALFFLRALLMARGADLVHVHSLDRMVPWMKRFYGKPVVMHYHGSDIKGRWDEKKTRWSRADFVAVSTPDLLEGSPASAVYVPNPVDTDIFGSRGRGGFDGGTAATFDIKATDEARRFADVLGLRLTVLQKGSVAHSELPRVLSRFEYYIDVKRGLGPDVLPALSLTGLEALACGCRVVNWRGDLVEGLPSENNPMSVAERWNGVYLELLKPGGGAGRRHQQA